MAATTLTATFNGIDEWQGSNRVTDYKDLRVTSSRIAQTQEDWEIMWESAHIGETVCPPAPKLPEGKYAVCVFSLSANDGKKMEKPSISTTDNGALFVDCKSLEIPSGMKIGAQHYYLKFIDAKSFKGGATIFRSPRPF